MKDTLRKDANAGDPYACLAVAYYHQTGKELMQDMPLAIRWYERAASAGCPRAHWELAKMYIEGEHVTRNVAHYLDHLQHAADLGNAEAQATLGSEYNSGYIMPRDLELAYRWYEQAAKQGVPRARFSVGYMLAHGQGVEQSLPEAETWFSSLAISSDGEMFLKIGMSYEYGLNMIDIDPIEAARWYKYGVDMGHEKCTICWNAVMAALDGAGPDSYEVRLHKLMTSQSQKEVDARANDLAYADEFFESGDEAGALTYYEEAAELGSPEAMFAIAMMHHQGIGVKRDDSKAMHLLARAASAGSEDAQFYLARFYENGVLGNDEDRVIKLYSDAAYNGFLAAFYYLGKYIDHPEIYVRRTHRGF